jgi:excisionase family DNA binding protein
MQSHCPSARKTSSSKLPTVFKDSRLAIEALTVEEIAAAGKISRAHVRNLIANGDLPSFTVGRCRRVLLADYLAFLERLKEENKRSLQEGQ